MKTLFLLTCLLCLALPMQATDPPRAEAVTVTVSPGDNGEKFAFDKLRDGDTVTVTVVPASGYTIKSSGVSDPAMLGWRKIANHVFKLTVSNPPTDKDWQKADFFGVLVPVSGPGSGEPPELPFTFNGRVKRLGGDEGATSDFARNPPASLTSVIPAVTPQDQGVATFIGDATRGTFDFRGTLEGTYTGLHGGTVDADPATRTPVHLSTASGPSPGGTGATVFISKHGSPNGVGGMAVGEYIKLNTFSADAAAKAKAAADARADANAKAAARRQADTDAAKAQQMVDDLIAKAVKAKADAAAKAGAKATAAAQAAATARQTAQTAQATYNQTVAQYGAQSARARQAKNAWDVATAAATKAAQDASTAATAAAAADQALADATAQAKTSPAVVAAQAAADVAKQAAATAAQAQADAERLADELEAKAAEAVEIDKAWTAYRAGTLQHENGHAKILHDHVAMLTDKLAHLEAIGWSPDQGRAKTLSANYWPRCWILLVNQLIKEEALAQQSFDNATGHGTK